MLTYAVGPDVFVFAIIWLSYEGKEGLLFGYTLCSNISISSSCNVYVIYVCRLES